MNSIGKNEQKQYRYLCRLTKAYSCSSPYKHHALSNVTLHCNKNLHIGKCL